MVISISAKLGGGKDLTGQIIQYLMTRKFRGVKYPISEEDFNTFIKNNHHLTCSWEIKKFADKLKDMVCMMLNCTREQLEDRVFKDTPLGEEWWYFIIGNNFNGDKSELYSYLDWKDLNTPSLDFRNLEPTKLTPRILMQLLGTEAGRNIIHPDLWVICTMNGYKECKCTTNKFRIDDCWDSCNYPNEGSKWIITDNRFPNEVKAVKRKNGLTLRIERDFNLRFPGYQNLEEVNTKDIDLYNQLTHFSETALDNYTDFDYIIQNNGTILDLIYNIEKILIKEQLI